METSSSETVSTKLERIAKLAKQVPGVALTTLAHHIDGEWLHEAYRRTRKDGAVGVDGQTAAEYAAHLEDNLGASGWTLTAEQMARLTHISEMELLYPWEHVSRAAARR